MLLIASFVVSEYIRAQGRNWQTPSLLWSKRRQNSTPKTASGCRRGGESTLVDDLLEQGFQNITVLDVSQAAIDVNKARLGERTRGVHWIAADITQVQLEPRAYDVWHDRAVFHFLTAQEQRTAYVRQVLRSVRSGGYVIVSTFGPEGPTKCSGLDVVRYDADSLHDEFGARFRLVENSKEVHQTPLARRSSSCTATVDWNSLSLSRTAVDF